RAAGCGVFTLNEAKQQVRASALALGLSVETGVSVTDQTVKRSISTDIPRKKTLLTKWHKSARLQERKPDQYWQHNLWSDKTKINEFGSDAVWQV
uniref:Transposase Tc1-like domain-containing protein n=1 Tax=Seriola lalandi dorsalis TaxID=1841481 RepID=A0A3B4WQV5_SERLL